MLKSSVKSAIPGRAARLARLRALGSTPLPPLTIASTLGGMRGAPLVYWESSRVDPEKGVTFHGKTIEQCQKELPTQEGCELAPETMFWYLVTGKVPSKEEAMNFSKELAERAQLPAYIENALDLLPKDLHPMAQLSIAVSLQNKESSFASAYKRGIPKTDCWEYVYDDVLLLLSRLPAMIGRIYRRDRGDDLAVNDKIKLSSDWASNLGSCMGNTNPEFVNLLRLYSALHADHEGGNVSSHTTHLVGSALLDPFLLYSAGIQGLAGPLHGLAAQEVVSFVVGIENSLKERACDDAAIEEYLWSVLNLKRVIPGYGHAVLRKPDPRFDAMLKFGLERESVANDKSFQLVRKISQIAPGVLKKHGKTKNPYPNVDSISGVLFRHYGLTEELFYTVVFAGSRAFGPLAQLIWDRILGLPIERPKSVDFATLEKLVAGR